MDPSTSTIPVEAQPGGFRVSKYHRCGPSGASPGHGNVICRSVGESPLERMYGGLATCAGKIDCDTAQPFVPHERSLGVTGTSEVGDDDRSSRRRRGGMQLCETCHVGHSIEPVVPRRIPRVPLVRSGCQHGARKDTVQACVHVGRLSSGTALRQNRSYSVATSERGLACAHDAGVVVAWQSAEIRVR